MKKGSRHENDMAELSKAITRALARSEEVIRILKDLKKNNQLQIDAMLAFILKADALLDIALKKNRVMPSNEQEISAPNKLLSSKLFDGEYIDGKKLTENEIIFEQYCSDRFNEKEWLIEHKIAQLR